MTRLATLGMMLMLVVTATPRARSADESALEIAGTKESLQPGDVRRLTVTAPAGVTAITGRALGQHLSFYQESATVWHALLGVDLDTKPNLYPLTISGIRSGQPAMTGEAKLNIVFKRFPTRRLRVASRFVDPPAAELERIKRETERMATVFLPMTPRAWDGPFSTPAATTPSSNFGSRSVYNGQKRNPHAGVDFGGDVGTSIAAPNAGEVVLAEDLYFTGNTVIVDHGLGLYSLCGHLSRIDVTVGQKVPKGATLGLLGATGRVTAPHLHWAVRLNGARVDPLSLVRAIIS